MANLTINVQKKSVTQVSKYKIEEDTEPRLVLRAKKSFYYLGGALLVAFAVFLAIAAVAVGGGAAVALAVVAALLALGAFALVRKGMRNKDRIIFDRATDTVSWDMTKAQDNLVVPFRELDCVALKVEDRSTSDGTCILYPVYLVKKDGNGVKIDEATNRTKMTALATKAATVCRVPLRDTTMAGHAMV